MRDFLVQASNLAIPTNAMRYAVHLARRMEGTLTSLYVREPVLPMGPVGVLPVVTVEDDAPAFAQQAQEAGTFFQRWAAEQGLTRHRWQVASGFLGAALAAAGVWHDALVLESGGKTSWNSVGMLGHAIVTCGLPCIVVPDDFDARVALDTVVVASNGRPEAVRAIHAALPLLARAGRIVLLRGDADDAFSAVDFQPRFDVETHLREHGLSFTTRRVDIAPADAGAFLLDAAAELRADLLVMGAYGRTRLSEWMLGGATRYALEHARLPILFRH